MPWQDLFPFSVPFFSGIINHPEGVLGHVVCSVGKSRTVPRSHNCLPGTEGFPGVQDFGANTRKVLCKSRTSRSPYFFPGFPAPRTSSEGIASGERALGLSTPPHPSPRTS